MIRIFSPTDTTFSTNGDIVVKPTKARVRKADNSDFYLDLETGLEYVDYLVKGNIIVAPTPQGNQAFRIDNPQKTKHKINVRAKHVFYDSENYLIESATITDEDCNNALDTLNDATEPTSPFTTLSDIGTYNSYTCVRKSLYEAINAVIAQWGGHLVRNNFNIQIRATIGQDNGVTVRYRKNLKEIVCVENWDKVVTKLLPVGKDGLLLPERYVVSVRQYSIPYTKTVTFTQDHVLPDDYKDGSGNVDEQAYQAALVNDLRQQAQNYIDTNSLPQVNYTLKANLEKVTDVGDTVQVIDERLGVNIMTNVIAYEYDCILGKYVELEFGNFRQTLGGLVSSLNANTEKLVKQEAEAIQVTLNSELQTATDQIWAALGNSYVIYEGDKILVVDRLPKNTAQNVIMINNGGIAFSQTGINGTFNSAWSIDGTLNMQAINVINLTANLIKGGTLKLGSNLNSSGILEIYDEANNLIGRMDKSGLKMYGLDGSYVLMNNDVGFAGYDRNNTQIYWVSQDEFHMKKSVVEEEITLCGQLRFIPIQITNGNNVVVNEGIGLVSSATGGA